MLKLKNIIKKILFYNKWKYKKSDLKKLLTKKHRIAGKYSYTVISAVYNVEKYLNDYFESIINQTLQFEKHIHLIMVDDGSPDRSVDIIKKWQRRYPNNITYIKKENGGQASARNLGMEYVESEWVTFIDPDDFVEYNYFESVDKFLTKQSKFNFAVISCNFIFYFEKTDSIKNTHPLKYRFKKKEAIFPVSDTQNFIQLSVNSAFFNSKILKECNIRADEKIKPNFEDAHFVNNFLLQTSSYPEEYFIAFIKEPKYLYRKRADDSSTLDTTWTKKEQYSDVLLYGCLDLLNKAKKYQKKIPLYIQRTVLYHLSWYFKYLLNNDEKLYFLSSSKKETFKNLLYEIFQFIDIETIHEFNLAGIWFYHKAGWLYHYKNHTEEPYIIYIASYDNSKHEVLVKYYCSEETEEEWLINGKSVKPVVSKIRDHTFIDEIFLYEKIVWLPLSDTSRLIKALINGKEAIWSLNGKRYKHSMDIEIIVKHFKPKSIPFEKTPLNHWFHKKVYTHLYAKRFQNAWLLMDRDTQADDNAEHLYRYIRDNHPETNIFFLLRETSHDWERLKKEGFNLIPFGSHQHKAALIHAVHNISSHADHYVVHYLPHKWYRDVIKSKYTFLQHGVTKDNLSGWLNNKSIDCFITAATREYDSIAGDHTPYKFTNKEVQLTGFPRHDALLQGAGKKEKIILIMPTWRQSLVGEVVGKSNTRTVNPDFKKTDYFQAWYSLLHSKTLKSISQQHGYTIIFFPHANIHPYLELFNIPEHIESISHNDGSIQKLFQRSALMITDYSSVAFEMAMLHREIIYYQFDHDEAFSGAHLTKKGYFNYEKDAFGPVCYQEENVLDELEELLQNNAHPREEYLKRMQNFFAFHDTKNCKRVFHAIKKLDQDNAGNG